MTPQEILEMNRVHGNEPTNNEEIREIVESNFIMSTNDLVDEIDISRRTLLDRREEIDGVEVRRISGGPGAFVWYATKVKEAAGFGE